MAAAARRVAPAATQAPATVLALSPAAPAFDLARWRADGWRAWLLGGGALLAALLSADETAIIHERFGAVILPYGQREDTVFREGGEWIVVLAPLLLLAALALWRLALRHYARLAPGAAWR